MYLVNRAFVTVVSELDKLSIPIFYWFLDIL